MSKIANHTTPTPRTKTPEQALSSLMRQCARAEKCSGDALRLMHRWGLSDVDAKSVLERLLRERFIDDSRYAAAYVREKSRLNGWGARKIAAALRAKRVSTKVIEEALLQISSDDALVRLEDMLRKKATKTTARDKYELKGKLVRFGVGRGFDLDDVLEVTERLLRE